MASLEKKSVSDLEAMLDKLAREALGLRIKHSLSELGQTHLLHKNKREIARVKTMLNMKRKSV